ncbi:MAG: ComF family protein [Clostridia bacterium]|nr:ComF family protein [Clostridia bacterium]
MEKLFKSAADILFPQHLKCHCCNREAVVNEYGVCSACEAKLKYVPILPAIRGVDELKCGMLYTEPARMALVSFKFNGAVYKKEFLAHFIEVPDEWNADCIVPVPLSANRMKERGYNQSMLLAEEVSKKSGIPIRAELLTRVRETEKQSLMTHEQRLKNLKRAFSASKECEGLRIILIDDIKTTGATLRECAQELKKRGAAVVYALTACCATEGKTDGG